MGSLNQDWGGLSDLQDSNPVNPNIPQILIQTVGAYSTVASTLIRIDWPALNSGQLLLVWARATRAMVRRRP